MRSIKKEVLKAMKTCHPMEYAIWMAWVSSGNAKVENTYDISKVSVPTKVKIWKM